MRGYWFVRMMIVVGLGSGVARTTAGDVSHLTTETIAEAGRSRVVHFTVAAAPDDRILDGTVSDSEVLQIIRPPTVLGGETTGAVRVRGLRPGDAILSVDGATLEVRVVPPRNEPEDHDTPRIVGPLSGAVIWGRLSIGVETRVRPDQPLRHIAIDVGGRVTLMPDEDTGGTYQPYRQLRFTLDTSELPEGPLELRAVATDERLSEHLGPAVCVQVEHFSSRQVTKGEAESRYELDEGSMLGGGEVTVRRDPLASGGMYVDNSAPYPAVAFPISVRRSGWYQVMVVARGTRAQGALPMVGVVVNVTNEPSTNGRVLGETWHRVAVGVPFRLGPGRHVLTPLFANDLAVPGLEDRNLHLDRIEVARVGYADPAPRGSAEPTDSGGADDDDRGDRVTLVGLEREVVDPFGLAVTPIRIGFVRPPDGMLLTGVVEVEAQVWIGRVEDAAPPTVTALINGRPVLSQRSFLPRFWIDPSQLERGINRLQLVASSDQGPVAATPVQQIRWAPPADPAPRRHLRFTVHDDRWQPGVRELLGGGNEPAARGDAAFFSRRAVALDLPDDLDGDFDVILEAWGGAAPAPVVSASLSNRRGMSEIGRVELPAGWSTSRVETATIPAGRQRLIVRLETDATTTPDHPLLLLRSVILSERPGREDDRAPTVALDYPAPGQAMHLADAVVARVADDMGLRDVELLVDDRPTGQRVDVLRKSGRVCVPLLLRELDAGAHTVAVRASDRAGNTTTSAPRVIEVLAETPSEPGRYTRAVRLLDRFAYGPDPHQLAEILGAGEEAWLARSLGRSFDDPGELAALGATFPRFPGLGPADVTGRVISHLLLTSDPARARFVLWAENHFSTWIRKVGAEIKWAEHVAFSDLGAAPFERLLFASAESPAMLTYLDQAQSYAGQLNENYAREIMELHTVGVDGGYDQADVTNLAQLLTGWTASLDGDGRSGGAAARRYTFRFDSDLNEGDVAGVFGVRFSEQEHADRFDRAVLAIEHLASHPSTARFIARKLASHYVEVPAPDDLVDRLAEIFLSTDGDMAAMLSSLARHETLVGANAPKRVSHPLEFVVRLYRATGHHDPHRAGEFLRICGHELFDHPSPDGYPEDDAEYVGTWSMLQRWRLALDTTDAIAAMVPTAWRISSEPTEDAWAQAVVDVIAIRLTGSVLSAASNQAALGVLAEAEGTRAERVRVIAPFIALLPEANLR